MPTQTTQTKTPQSTEERLARAAEQARADAEATTDRAVARAVRAEQRRIEGEARREREAEERAHYKSEYAIDNGLDGLPREIADKVFDYAYAEGHSDGWHNVSAHYADLAPLILAAYEAGQQSK